MKIFRVVTEHDGATTKEPGKTSTEIERTEYRYAAETIEEVWEAAREAAAWKIEEVTIIAIVEEAPSVIVLPQRHD